MCGIIGLLLANEDAHVNQGLFDGLTVLQHRGQDAAGMVTAERTRLHLRKDNGLVRDVFQTHHMLELRGHVGIGHCRYPTAGSSSCAEAQPLYTNYPYGICVAHNGNLVNTDELVPLLHHRHVNTDSDSEVLLNLFADALCKHQNMESSSPNGNNNNITPPSMPDAIFDAMTYVMKVTKGGYAGLYLINGIGLVGFRDPHGIRPIVFGCRPASKDGSEPEHFQHGVPLTPQGLECAEQSFDYCVSSESVAIDTLGFSLVRDIKAGEAIFMDMKGNCHSRVCYSQSLSPCIFEYVYFARPDSIMDGVSVYETRLRMGDKLARKIIREYGGDSGKEHDIDVVIPIPDTSRTAALQAAYVLDVPFREGFIKNRYIARTFIMPGQATRRKSVRLKLNTIKPEFAGKNVLLVDDSIVRGTTAREIVLMARDVGAKKVFFSSAAPPIRYPNIYGIDIPTRNELVAYERTEPEISQHIGADWVVYQDLKDLEDCIKECTPEGKEATQQFDTSCFSGTYVTGEQIGDDYFSKLHDLRNDGAKEKREHPPTNGSGRPPKRPQQSNDGCESVSNDTRANNHENGENGCEPIANKPVGVVR